MIVSRVFFNITRIYSFIQYNNIIINPISFSDCFSNKDFNTLFNLSN